MRWIFRYLWGTIKKCLCFRTSELKLYGCVDADYAGYVDANYVDNVENKKSTTAYVFFLGGTALCWVSQLQRIMILFTNEVEYVTMTEPARR